MIFNRLSICRQEDEIGYFYTDDKEQIVNRAEFNHYWSDEVWPMLF